MEGHTSGTAFIHKNSSSPLHKCTEVSYRATWCSGWLHHTISTQMQWQYRHSKVMSVNCRHAEQWPFHVHSDVSGHNWKMHGQIEALEYEGISQKYKDFWAYSRGAQIFHKRRSYLKILEARRATQSKFHIEDLKILGTTIKNVVATAIWHPGFMHIWTTVPWILWQDLKMLNTAATWVSQDVCKAQYQMHLLHEILVTTEWDMQIDAASCMLPHKHSDKWARELCHNQWRTQEFCSGGFNKFSWGQRERRSGGNSPLLRGSGGSCNLVQEISFHIVKFSSFLVL